MSLLKKIFYLCLIFSLSYQSVNAETYLTGQVLQVSDTGSFIVSLANKKEVSATNSTSYSLKIADKVVILENSDSTYQIIDIHRLDLLVVFFCVFICLVLVITGFRGVGSLLGLLFSLFVILQFLIPRILSGTDPLLASILTSSLIMIVNMYLSHGLTKTTHIALISTIISLALTGIISVFMVHLAKLTGLGDDSAGFLILDPNHSINLQGLLLGGIIIGSLGVLDDVTVNQTTAIFEIKKSAPHLSPAQLVQKGLTLGREHVHSLVNTLVLAYAGSSLSLLVLLVLNPAQMPPWYILNNEPLAQEIIRTLSGSIGIILAIPITTLLASHLTPKNE